MADILTTRMYLLIHQRVRTPRHTSKRCTILTRANDSNQFELETSAEGVYTKVPPLTGQVVGVRAFAAALQQYRPHRVPLYRRF